MTSRARTRSRWWIAAAVVAVAVLLAGLIGLDDRATYGRGVDGDLVRVALGEVIEGDGLRITIDAVDAAETWPNQSEYSDDPLQADPGTVIVRLRYRVERVGAGEAFCRSSLVTDPGTDAQQRWEPMGFGSDLAGPAARSYCSQDPEEGMGDEVVEGFVVPADVADRVQAMIIIGETRVVAER